jgi:putative membrane protein
MLLQEFGAYESFAIFFATVGIFILLAWFLIAVFLAVFVYRDAEKRGMSGGMWLIIILITGLFGFIVYFIVRKPVKKKRKKSIKSR